MYIKPSPKEWIDRLQKRKAQCKQDVEIIKKAIQEKLQPQSVWLQEKKKIEKRIKDIDESLDIFKNLLKKYG